MKDVKTYYKHWDHFLYRTAIAGGVQQQEKDLLPEYTHKNQVSSEKNRSATNLKPFTETNTSAGNKKLMVRFLFRIKQAAGVYCRPKGKSIAGSIEQVSGRSNKSQKKLIKL